MQVQKTNHSLRASCTLINQVLVSNWLCNIAVISSHKSMNDNSPQLCYFVVIIADMYNVQLYMY